MFRGLTIPIVTAEMLRMKLQSWYDHQICITVNCATVQAELRKFLQQQEAGLDTTFRCIRCRDCKQCLKGAGEERKSMTQEAHQEIIRQSVSIDKVGRKATAKLPFVID